MATNIGGGKIIMVGVAFGLASTVLLYVYLRRQSQSSKVNSQLVVVARTEIPVRAQVTADNVVLLPTQPAFITPGALQDPKMIEGKLARHGIHANAQITAADLMVSNEISGLAIRVPAGKRAIAIAASEVIAVGTTIKPGDHVDILATYRDPDLRIETTQLILQNAPVLAVNIGQTDPETPEGAKSSITLAVAPEDTERLTAAAVAGQLRVALRSPTDATVISTPGVTVKDIAVDRLAGPSEAPAPAVVKPVPGSEGVPPPPPVERTVQSPRITIIRGTEVLTVAP